MFIHGLTASRLVYMLVSVDTFKAGKPAFSSLDFRMNADRIMMNMIMVMNIAGF
jgi:hypothetical protein